MLSERVRIGNRVEIGYEEDRGRKKYHRTKVDNIISPTLITVQTPQSTDSIFRVEVGDKLELYSFEDGLIYLYRVKVESQFIDENIKMLNLEILSDAKETQRREFFRFDCNLEMIYDNLNNTLNDKEMQQATIKNIGGGGVKFLSNEDMDLKDKALCQFKFRDIDFELLAIILGKEKLEDGLKYRFRYRCKWDRMSQRNEDRLIKCIFEEQAAQTKRSQF